MAVLAIVGRGYKQKLGGANIVVIGDLSTKHRDLTCLTDRNHYSTTIYIIYGKSISELWITMREMVARI